MKKKNKKYPLTPDLISLYNTLMALGEAKTIIAKPQGFWVKRIDVTGLIEVHKEWSVARTNFWASVIRVYPDLQGVDVSSGVHEITII